MYTILISIIILSNQGASVTSQQMGRYQTVPQCLTVADQINKVVDGSHKGYATIITSAQCIYIGG